MLCTREVTVQVPDGLHHQTAARFIQTANRFTSVVRVVYGDNNVNAKSLLGVLSLSIGAGTRITITADGADAGEALDALERKCGARRFRAIFKSITFDNGSEFSAAEELERSAVNKTIPRTKVYFCHPYSSWERGSNENANSMIRRRHPKGTDFSKVSAAEIAATEEWINNYPRKIFGYKSSEVMFRECLREIGLIA